MPLGDSITKGSRSTGIVGYRKILYESLAAKYGAASIDFVGSASNGSFPQPEHNGYSGYQAVDPDSSSVDDFLTTWLNATPPDIILLHIGTNDIDDVYSADEVATLLDMIDDYSLDVYVFLALIINRYPFSQATASFNDDVEAMANARITSGDLITMIDMENGAGLNYSLDLDDGVHPNDSGYGKMASAWFTAIDNLCSGAPLVTGPGNKTYAEGDAVNLYITATDPDSDPIAEYGASNLPPGLQVNTGTGLIYGTISYDAAANSPYEVTVTAKDGTGVIGSATFVWTITNTNRPPQVIQPADQIHAEGAPVNLQIVATDPDAGNVVLISASNLPPGLEIDPSDGWVSGTISYTAYKGTPYSVQVTATDDGSPVLSDSKTFTWTISNTNRAPVFDVLPEDQEDNEGELVSLQILASDPDPDDMLVYSASGLPGGLAIDPASGLIGGVLSYNASIGSPHPVSVTVSDGNNPVTANFTWQVGNLNGPPQVADPGSQTDGEMHPVDLQIQASDPDLTDTITFSLGTGGLLPAGLQLDPETGFISGMIASGASENSPYRVTVIVKDSGSPQLSDQVTFDWNVVPFNFPPGGQGTIYLPLVIH